MPHQFSLHARDRQKRLVRDHRDDTETGVQNSREKGSEERQREGGGTGGSVKEEPLSLSRPLATDMVARLQSIQPSSLRVQIAKGSPSWSEAAQDSALREGFPYPSGSH